MPVNLKKCKLTLQNDLKVISMKKIALLVPDDVNILSNANIKQQCLH